MERVTKILATTNEISLKGGNRRWFERQLNANLKAALTGLPVVAIQRPAWRVMITFSTPVELGEVARRMTSVFGLNSFMPVVHAGHTLEELYHVLGDQLESLTTESFAVRCIRSDKRFPMTSPEIERQVGRFVQERTGWKVDLTRPGLTVRLLVDDKGLYLWTRRIPGSGGLPVGVSGRSLCLLSGGIDSPVAAYLMMKRGMRLHFVHFHSMPRTDPASVEKVHDLVAILNRFQGSAKTISVPLLEIQEQIVARCPAQFRVLLYRRFMLRISELFARRFRCCALITGEALGQVSSQTVENMAAVEAVTSLPVFRPLIGFDKQEIIAVARRVGSYETSILPHMDCCSFLLPDSPATRSEAVALDRAEQSIDVPALVDSAVERSEVIDAREAAPWSEMPTPEEALV
jgi:thiamine biosynthesis protein ThiI